jgi:NAD(P)-dependent dehydrogenase (short-subunit alcohol dehydrogenase family)
MSDPTTLLDVASRVVMISGASRGIGRALAERLAQEGYRLSLGVRRPGEAAKALGLDPAQTLFHPFEAADPASAAPWLAATLERFGAVDVLINNAGIFRKVTFEEGEADLDALFAVNVKAPYRMISLALPHLRRCGHGRIVNIASTDGKRFRDSSASIGYVMSKHALVALSHAAKFAGWDEGVRVTALCPGAVETELIAGVPGVAASRLSPNTLGDIVSLLLRLPNTASVAELVVNTRLESTL